MRLASLVALMLALPGGLAAQASTTPGVTLDEAIRRAQVAQPSVVAAQGAVGRAAAQYRSSWGAFIPSVDLNSTYGTNYSNGPARSDPNTGQVLSSGQSYNQSLNNRISASVDLFTGFRRGAEMDAARANEMAASAGLLNAQYQTALSAKQTFFGALAADALVRVRELSVRRAQDQLNVSGQQSCRLGVRLARIHYARS